MYIIFNKENDQEYEYRHIEDARKKLLALSDKGICAYMLIDRNKYHNIEFNN